MSKDLLKKTQAVMAKAEKAKAARRAKILRAVEELNKPVAGLDDGAENETEEKPEVEAKTEVEAADASEAPNGGFEGHGLNKAAELQDQGEEDLGAHIPPELAKAVEDGKAEDAADASYQPGVLIPPGLEEAVMAFVDPATLSSEEEVRFDMIPFLPENARTTAEVVASGAHWVLCANGDPLAKISLEDQEDAERIAANFVSADYAMSIVKGIGKHGLKEVLASTNAKPYVAKIDENAKVQSIRAELEAEAETRVRAAIADVKSKYMNTLDLVLKASATNFIADNRLKDGMIAWAHRDLGTPEHVAAAAIDNLFFQHGPDTMAALLAKAEEWANWSPESLQQLRATVDETASRGPLGRPLPSSRSPAEANPNYDRNLAASMAAAAVPVSQPSVATTPVAANVGNPEPAASSEKVTFRNRFRGFGRLPQD